MLEYVANIIKDNEIKLEKEETPILDSNLLEIDLSGKDIKDEDDSMKVEEFDDIHNDRASPFDESSDSPIKLVSNKGLRGIAHEKRSKYTIQYYVVIYMVVYFDTHCFVIH